MDDDITTEFLYLDTEELHLVGMGANGFAPLLAKAAAEVDAVLGETDFQSVLYEMGAEKALCDVSDCDACTSVIEKAKLKAKQRNALPDSDFALPGRRYPIHDESHARNALSRVSQNGTPEEKAKVRAAVHRRYPNIGKEDAEKTMLSQDAGETQAGNLGPEAALGQTHGLGERGPVHMETAAEGGTPPSMPQPRPDEHQGGGDTAPDKTIPQGEALSQTNSVHKEEEAEKAKPVEVDNDSNDNDDDDAEKVALKEIQAVLERHPNFTLSRATELMSGLVDGTNNNQVATKEIEDMTKDELIELLDARDAQKEAERKAKKEAKLAKASGEGQPSPEESTPVEKSEEGKDETVTLTKSAWDEFQARLKNLEDQPARPRVAVNDAGIRAGATAPSVRGQEEGGNAFKELEDRVEAAQKSGSLQGVARAKNELLMAKMISAEHAREANPASRGPVPLIATGVPTKEAREAMAADFRG